MIAEYRPSWRGSAEPAAGVPPPLECSALLYTVSELARHCTTYTPAIHNPSAVHSARGIRTTRNILRLAGPFGRCASLSCAAEGPATTSCSGVRRMRLTLPSLDDGEADARSRGVTLTRLSDFVRCHLLWQAMPA
jgi:hypothetical protein